MGDAIQQHQGSMICCRISLVIVSIENQQCVPVVAPVGSVPATQAYDLTCDRLDSVGAR